MKAEYVVVEQVVFRLIARNLTAKNRTGCSKRALKYMNEVYDFLFEGFYMPWSNLMKIYMWKENNKMRLNAFYSLGCEAFNFVAQSAMLAG